jgi:hypothetical protein
VSGLALDNSDWGEVKSGAPPIKEAASLARLTVNETFSCEINCLMFASGLQLERLERSLGRELDL